MTISGSCHCGNTRLEVSKAPKDVTRCTCSFCSKSGSLWAYYKPAQFRLTSAPEDVATYQWGSRTVKHHFCASCGCGTYSESPDWSTGKPDFDNPRVGVGVFDHVLAMVTYDYNGPIAYQAYDYGDYAGNAADLRAYLASGRGPYAQYQPVSILNYASSGNQIPDVEIFLNPNGAGVPGGPYYGPGTLSAFLMLLDPKARGIVGLDARGNVIAPDISCRLPTTATWTRR